MTLITLYTKEFDFDAVVPLSAKTGDGVDILLNELYKFSKPSPHYFGDDDITDQPERVMVAEMIREQQKWFGGAYSDYIIAVNNGLSEKSDKACRYIAEKYGADYCTLYELKERIEDYVPLKLKEK